MIGLMKNIHFIVEKDSAGGIASVLKTIVKEFSNRGFNVQVHTVFEKDEILNYINYIKKLKNILSLVQKDNNYKCFILSMGKLSILSAFFITERCKFICFEHTSFQGYTYLVRLLKIITYLRYEKVITLTKFDEKILRRYRVNASVIVNPINFSINSEDKKNNKRFLFVGHLIDYKGVLELINIWNKFKYNKEYSLMMVGDGFLSEKLKKIVIDNKLNVEFISKSDDMKKIYSISDVLLTCSQKEGLPMVVLESFACSIPVIAYDSVPGFGEMISDGVNGFLIENNNEKKFLSAMNLLVENNDRLLKMSKNTLNTVSENKIEYVIDKWIELI